MAIVRTWFHALPVDPTNGSAALQLIDAQNNGPIGWNFTATANDGGSIIDLTVEENEDVPNTFPLLVANPVAVGVASVTVSVWEDQAAAQQVQTGTLTCTVTLAAGHLVAAWTAGSITLH